MNTQRLGHWRGVWLGAICLAAAARAQDAPPTDATPAEAIDRRIFGVMPNYRTADGSQPFVPMQWRRKLYIAYKDSTDWPVIPTAAVFASIYHLQNQNPSFGQGMQGYGKRFLAAYGDQALGNALAEGVVPALLHQDPRYFRLGHGTTRSRLLYAASRIFICKGDNGRTQFNFSEVLGNSAGAAISNLYCKDGRTAHDNVRKLAVSLSTDSLSQLGKEFWPDLKRRFFHHDRD